MIVPWGKKCKNDRNERPIPDTGYGMQDTGYGIQDAGRS